MAAALATLRKLLDHLAWADARVLEGLRHAPGSDPAALERFAHVLGAEEVWLARLEERAPRAAVWPAPDLDALAALAAANARGLRAFVERLGDAGLAREVAYANSAGQAFRSRVDDILLHVVLHGCYHRGQVAFAVRRSGGEPAPTDYIALVRGAAAATRGGG